VLAVFERRRLAVACVRVGSYRWASTDCLVIEEGERWSM
jgi:hypothetical protein